MNRHSKNRVLHYQYWWDEQIITFAHNYFCTSFTQCFIFSSHQTWNIFISWSFQRLGQSSYGDYKKRVQYWSYYVFYFSICCNDSIYFFIFVPGTLHLYLNNLHPNLQILSKWQKNAILIIESFKKTT